MNNAAVYDELDLAVEKILSGKPIEADRFDPLVEELLPLAEDLRALPRAEFRAQLLAELETVEKLPFLPALFGAQSRYPVSRSNIVISAAMHAALLALLCTSSLWIVQHKAVPQRVTTILSDLGPYFLPPAPKPAGGGGGGGDRDRLTASKGAIPRFSDQQVTPPAIVVRNNDPKLAMEPTVVGPPTIHLSKLETGDPLSSALNPSNGFGTGGGIGTGGPGGIGDGHGAGLGAGYGGGFGGGTYRVGNGVSAPRALYAPDPQYTDEARKARYQGVVVLSIIVGPDGRTHNPHVARSLGMGLDERAVEAVRQWKFSPAMKDGQPVPVLVNVEVNFRLY